MKTKFLIKMAFAFAMTASLTSCSSDEPNKTEGDTSNSPDANAGNVENLTLVPLDTLIGYDSDEFNVKIVAIGTNGKASVKSAAITAVYTFDTNLFGKPNPWIEVDNWNGTDIHADLDWIKVSITSDYDNTPVLHFAYAENESDGRAIRIDVKAVCESGAEATGSYVVTQREVSIGGICDVHDAFYFPGSENLRVGSNGGEFIIYPTLKEPYTTLNFGERDYTISCDAVYTPSTKSWDHWDWSYRFPSWAECEKTVVDGRECVKVTIKPGVNRGIRLLATRVATGEQIRLGYIQGYILFGTVEIKPE